MLGSVTLNVLKGQDVYSESSNICFVKSLDHVVIIPSANKSPTAERIIIIDLEIINEFSV